MARTIVRLYDDFAAAQAVAHELVNAGFARENISIMANDASGEYSTQLGTTTTGEADAGGAGAGAGIGAALGGGVGLLIGLGALAIPGIGPVIAAGPVLSALATAGVGAGLGAVAGGLVGALVDMGVPEEEAQYYAEGVRRGGAILTVHAPDEAEERAMNIINRSESVDVAERASWWRQQGWNSFDPNASPYSADDVTRERTFYQSYTTHRSADNPAATGGSRGWTEVEPAPGDDSYRSDAPYDPTYDSRGWVEVEPPAEETIEGLRTSHPERYTATAAGVSSPGLVEDRPPAGGRNDVTANADYTWEETKDNVREGWEETKDTVREGWQETKEAVREGWEEAKDTFDDDDDYDTYDPRFREHFNTAYVGRGLSYDAYAPAYRYGYDLAYDVDFEDRDWDEFEPEARQYWESTHEGPWEQFKDAVRHAWEETKEAIGLEVEEDFKTYDSRFREHYNTSYGTSGYDYSYYIPAYRYGYDLAYDVDFENRDWNEFEPEARQYWESNYQGGWEQFKDAVRHGWEETKEALGFEAEDDFDTYDPRFREHYNTHYISSGYDYDTYYAPAYRYGYDLAYDPDFDNRTWDEVEADVRTEWEADYEGPWEQFKDAVRHAWEETKEALGLADDDDDLTEFNRQRRSGNISQ